MGKGSKKTTRSHTTVIDAAKPILRALDNFDGVEKIALGQIKVIKGKSGPKRVKITKADAGLKLLVKGNNSIQVIWVYTKQHRNVARIIERVKGKGPPC
ncbi:hypothetical protein KC644_01790 [Candidatus Berkelbacteria bacterium]|nr:hypothetical protein [Candidatus Berkelbacteria bacterium]